MWRVVLAGRATLHELRTVYTVSDLMDFQELLDLEAEIEDRRERRAQRLAAASRRSKGGRT